MYTRKLVGLSGLEPPLPGYRPGFLTIGRQAVRIWYQRVVTLHLPQSYQLWPSLFGLTGIV